MAKSPRLDLFEKLSELKAWQSKQQEKLLAQQMDQENMLRRQQKQEMDLFGSRKTEVITSQNLATVRVQSDKQNLRDRDEIATRNQVVERNVEDDDTGNILGNVSLDDIPVKTLNLRFEELLEEKLKDVQNNPRERNEVKPKRHFLKKGEGLKRFRMKSPNEFLKANASNGPQKCSKKCNSKETSSTQNRNTANFRASNSKSKAAEVMPVKDQRAVGLNTQPPAKGSESTTWSHMLHQEQQRCPTKMEGIRKGEAEDLKVFELLEQMAVDSSFCSTSSTLLGFMESPIISTPLKAILEHRRELKGLKSPKQLPFGMDESDEETDDFASSSESYSSENDTSVDKANDAAVLSGSCRVRFSSLVEEREYDPGMSKENSFNIEDDFKDKESWSNSDATNDPIEEAPAEEKQAESSPSSERDSSSSSAPGMIGTENSCRNSEIILKSELLHRRLLELEHEIETFRKENEELSQRKRLQQQAMEKWIKEKSEAERRLKEREDELKNSIQEERQKLNREKRVFETYSKKMTGKPPNHQEVEILQKKMAELQLELCEKERKNSAAYNRISNRVKVLEKENSELKEEIEKLKKEKQAESKKTTTRVMSKKKSVGNTKALHQINDELTRIPPVALEAKEVNVARKKPLLRKEPVKVSAERKKNADAEEESDEGIGVSLQRIQSVPSMLRRSHLDEDLTENAKVDKDTCRSADLKEFSSKCGSEVVESTSNFVSEASIASRKKTDCVSGERQSSRAGSEATKGTVNSSSQCLGFGALPTFPSEKTNPDGSREIRYENGNFKKISPDGLNTKLFYFNGDVKETLSDGTIKYYYSETRTWHTSFSDGLEILEFPNGQVERHFQGTVEVAFPDGTVRVIHKDGREELRLPDGTKVINDSNGDKIIFFPNGQKEHQTNDFKKRVYPDGTVKIVYSDGVQETRYSNGRVRLKDAGGSLLMDSES